MVNTKKNRKTSKVLTEHLRFAMSFFFFLQNLHEALKITSKVGFKYLNMTLIFHEKNLMSPTLIIMAILGKLLKFHQKDPTKAAHSWYSPQNLKNHPFRLELQIPNLHV